MPQVGTRVRVLALASVAVVAGCGGEATSSGASSGAKPGRVAGWPGLVGTPKLYYYDAKKDVRTAGYVLVVRLKRPLPRTGEAWEGVFHIDKGSNGARASVWGDATGPEGETQANVCLVATLDNEAEVKPPRFPRFDPKHRYQVSYANKGRSTETLAKVKAERLTRADGSNRPGVDIRKLAGPAGCKRDE